jgi:large subunit ribosomal protein L21
MTQKQDSQEAAPQETKRTISAVVKTGGKQYRLAPKQRVVVEKLDKKVGDVFDMSDVLMFTSESGDVQIGAPFLENVKVQARVLGEVADKKVIIFKKKRRKGYQKKLGHRQKKTELMIEDISNGS